MIDLLLLLEDGFEDNPFAAQDEKREQCARLTCCARPMRYYAFTNSEAVKHIAFCEVCGKAIDL